MAISLWSSCREIEASLPLPASDSDIMALGTIRVHTCFVIRLPRPILLPRYFAITQAKGTGVRRQAGIGVLGSRDGAIFNSAYFRRQARHKVTHAGDHQESSFVHGRLDDDSLQAPILKRALAPRRSNSTPWRFWVCTLEDSSPCQTHILGDWALLAVESIENLKGELRELSTEFEALRLAPIPGQTYSIAIAPPDVSRTRLPHDDPETVVVCHKQRNVVLHKVDPSSVGWTFSNWPFRAAGVQVIVGASSEEFPDRRLCSVCIEAVADSPTFVGWEPFASEED